LQKSGSFLKKRGDFEKKLLNKRPKTGENGVIFEKTGLIVWKHTTGCTIIFQFGSDGKE
jgi:hypothetical protein